MLNAEPPDFPRNLHVIEKGSRHINLGWTTSQDGNSPITQYIIEYKTESGEYNRDQHVCSRSKRVVHLAYREFVSFQYNLSDVAYILYVSLTNSFREK